MILTHEFQNTIPLFIYPVVLEISEFSNSCLKIKTCFFPTDLKNEGVEQRVAMWHYQSWPDQGSPDDPLTFFEIIHSLKAKP